MPGTIPDSSTGGCRCPVGVWDTAQRRCVDTTVAERQRDIEEQKKAQGPFFLMIGFTRSHFPNDVSEEFKGKSGAGKYGDSMYELDYRTGQVIEALEKNGFEDNTIVIWLSDNAATVTGTAVEEVHQGDNGPFRGELGDAYEGSIRTAGMIKWPGVIKPQTRSNEMISVHDFLPTFASILGEELPQDRPYDGYDQKDFIMGKQENSNRNSLITFIGGRIAAIRWNQYRIYPMLIGNTANNPSNGGYVGTAIETAGFPQIFNIEVDPKERVDQAVNGSGWVLGVYPKIIAEYKKTLEQYPNPPVPNLTKF
jgi:arylsulfatase